MARDIERYKAEWEERGSECILRTGWVDNRAAQVVTPVHSAEEFFWRQTPISVPIETRPSLPFLVDGALGSGQSNHTV